MAGKKKNKKPEPQQSVASTPLNDTPHSGNPSEGDKVLISFGSSNQLCEVLYPWLQADHISPDGMVAVVVKEHSRMIIPHKSKDGGYPHWEWPAQRSIQAEEGNREFPESL